MPTAGPGAHDGLSRAIGAKLFATGSVDKERERDHAEQIGVVGMDGSASSS